MQRKNVLIIDESDLFREYLKDRLAAAGLGVEAAINGLDGVVKLRNGLPDLVIMDYNLTRRSCKEVLEEKNRNPNTAGIPVVLTAQKIDKNRLLELVPYNIKRVIMKPIKIDGLFATLSETLGLRLEIDSTPCVIEAHVNDSIVFVEIAKGLNREKIDLLRFKIAELLELYSIRNPRILVMLADMELSFVDGTNMELLLKTLELAEYTVDTVPDGQAAIERLRLGAFDLLITDLKMPGVDGLAVIRAARRLQPALPVVIITGYSTEAAAIEAIELGVTGYLTKPFRVPKVLAVVARALGE